jgi:arsenite-transporting ATPase
VRSKRRKSPRSSASVKSQISSHLSSSRYFFFGGKGGVGKTTAAAATALVLLGKAKSQEKILLFSTDPAHSLSDSLKKRIGNRLVEVLRRGNAKLFAFEMDSKSALEEFRNKHGKVLAEIAERGTFLDEADISELLNLSLPGLDEVMALFELSELDRSGVYSHIVIDTAPSGHTTRLLALPEVFTRMVTALDRMSDKHRYMVAHFARRQLRLDEVDLFLRDLNERIGRVKNILFNAKDTRFALVAIPEAMSVNETERYADVLDAQGVVLSDVIINRVEEEHEHCDFCRARVANQQPHLKELERRFKNLQIHRLALQPAEVRGIEALDVLGKQLWSSSTKPKTKQGSRRRSTPEIETSDKSDFPLAGRRIWIFGGKGGVGKTTAAASFALALAKEHPRQSVLLFSTDPAHSLSDSFEETIGPLKRRVGGRKNLDAMEIDPGKWFEDLKQRYRSWTDSLFSSLAGGSGLEVKFDREAMRELVELTPPGIDEIAALGAVSDLLDQDQYHTIVLDTAPTGHLIRFLELPEVALGWVRTFIKLLLKYQHVVHASEVAEELVAMSKRIKRVLALLKDPALCEFVGVAIPERMSLLETQDLADALKRLQVQFSRVLINGVVPEAVVVQCRFCSMRRSSQDEVITEFRKQLGKSVDLFVCPQREREITGADLLLKHFYSWRKLGARETGLRRKPLAVKNVTQVGRKNERKQSEKRAGR